jgi:hypothetical protein
MQKVKKFLSHFLVILLAVQGAVATQLLTLQPVFAGDDTPEVIINEIMWMGSTASTADEWVELRNTTSSPIDLTDWTLTGIGLPADALDGLTVAAEGYLLLSNYPLGHANTVLDIAPDYVNASVAISNTCSAIALVNTEAVTVDEMGCSGGSYFGGENTAVKRSLSRNYHVTDGTLTGSWHTSPAFANLIGSVQGDVFASPKVANDQTAPLTGSAFVLDTDGVDHGTDVNWTASVTELHAAWGGFTDPESGIDRYEVSHATNPAGPFLVGWTDVGANLTATITDVFVPGTTYYLAVRSTNGVGLVGDIVVSDGVTVDIDDPDDATDLTATDVPNDNGGSVELSWLPSPSADVVGYSVEYRVKGELGWTLFAALTDSPAVVDGLENFPTVYEFRVTAVDFNAQTSVGAVVEGSALDNLAPVLDTTKVLLTQNKPGTDDTIHGLPGAANEPATVYVFDRDPSDPMAQLINSVLAEADGGFPLMSIGDNRYARIWMQLVDTAGNPSEVEIFDNDIVAPNPPTLTGVTASCVGDPCRVTLAWQDNGPDTAYYVVGYTSDGVEQRSMAVQATAAALDLAAEKHYEFRIFAYDQYGNQSAPSNVFALRLTLGVKTTAQWQDGQQLTSTEAIYGAKEVRRAAPSGLGSVIAPPVQAGNGEPEDVEALNGNEMAEAERQDRARIVTVALLLLIIAGSFYALSRSMKEPTSRGGAPAVSEEPVSKPGKKQGGAKKRGRPRKRP